MQALPDVEQAVTHACVINQAAATGGDARQLVGYLVSQSGLPLDTSALQAQLRETLPHTYGTGGSAATSTVTT